MKGEESAAEELDTQEGAAVKRARALVFFVSEGIL